MFFMHKPYNKYLIIRIRTNSIELNCITSAIDIEIDTRHNDYVRQ